MRLRPVPVALALAAAVALGCGITVPADPSANGPVRTTTPVTPVTEEPDSGESPETAGGTDGTDTPQEFASDLKAASELAETYWQDQFDASGIAFEPVAELISYDTEGDVACGDQSLGLNNAAYCSAGDFIAYDVNWAFAAFQQVGDAFIFYLLGHEYAHAIQTRLGIRKQYTIQQELQADCMAGAYIGDLERDGRLRLDDGDTEELEHGLDVVADQPGQPWFADDAHGTADQRIEAFSSGYQDGLTPCELS